MSGEIKEVTKSNWNEEVIQSGVPTLVDFWAPWCGPCRMLAPTLKSIQSERDDVKVVKLNIDEEGEIANQFRIMNIPFMMLFKNGESAGSLVGNQPRNKIESFLKDHV